MPTYKELEDFKKALGAGKPKLFLIGADATGDVPHVYAAHKKGTIKGIVIFEWNPSKGDAMQAKFVSLGMQAAHCKVVALKADEIAPIRALFPNDGTGNSEAKARKVSLHKNHDLTARNGHRDFLTYLCQLLGFSVEPLHKSTEFAVAALEDAKVRKEMHIDFRGAKGIDDVKDAGFVAFWKDKLEKVGFEKHVVVLWGRTSGRDKTKDGNLGPHLYGDSSNTGVAQVAEVCTTAKHTVVVAGDFAAEKAGRFQNCAFIGKFWNDFEKYKITNSQKNQIRLFYVLKQIIKQHSKRLVHVGMRSGNLDNFAFAGQTIIYMVPVGFDDRRIEQLAKPSDKAPVRWIQTRTEASPRVAYRKDLRLPDEVGNLVKQSDLRFLADNQTRFTDLNKSLKEAGQPDFYPMDAESKLNANILYRAIKAELKGNSKLDEKGIFSEYIQKKRGFSAGYLQELLTKINGALVKPDGASK